MEITWNANRELKMKGQRGYVSIKILLFVMALILMVLFFLA
jgi:hypothetical protein